MLCLILTDKNDEALESQKPNDQMINYKSIKFILLGL